MVVLLEILFILQHVVVFGFVFCGIDFYAFVHFDFIQLWLCFYGDGFVELSVELVDCLVYGLDLGLLSYHHIFGVVDDD